VIQYRYKGWDRRTVLVRSLGADIIYVQYLIKVNVKWMFVQAVRPIGGVEVYIYSFMTTELQGGEGSA